MEKERARQVLGLVDIFFVIHKVAKSTFQSYEVLQSPPPLSWLDFLFWLFSGVYFGVLTGMAMQRCHWLLNQDFNWVGWLLVKLQFLKTLENWMKYGLPCHKNRSYEIFLEHVWVLQYQPYWNVINWVFGFFNTGKIKRFLLQNRPKKQKWCFIHIICPIKILK